MAVKKKYILWLLVVILLSVMFYFKQCTIQIGHKRGRHYVEYVSRGITNKMYFHSDNNPYVGKLEEKDGKYILTVIDTVTDKEYILMSEYRIRITGGDINFKMN